MTEVGLTFQLTKRSANPLNHSMGSRLTHRAMNWNWTDPARAEAHRNKTSSRPESHSTEFTTGWGTKREAPRPNPNAVTVSRRHRASHPPPPRPRAPHTPPTTFLLYPASSLSHRHPHSPLFAARLVSEVGGGSQLPRHPLPRYPPPPPCSPRRPPPPPPSLHRLPWYARLAAPVPSPASNSRRAFRAAQLRLGPRPADSLPCWLLQLALTR